MSSNDLAPAKMTASSWLMLPQAANHLAEMAAHAIASAVLRRTACRARRELAALDDRALADIGLVRAELTSLLEVLAERRTTAVFAQFLWNLPRKGA